MGRRVRGREKIKNAGGNRRGVGNNATICQLSNCAAAWWGEFCWWREAGRRSEMKNAGLGTGMAGGIKVLWDQVLLTGGTSANSGWVRRA